MPDGATDDIYLLALADGLAQLFKRFAADLVIYLAGADPFEDDRLGRLKLSMDGLRRRDELVFAACAARHLPVALAMAGGYARKIEDTVAIHAQTVLLGKRLLARSNTALIAKPAS